MPPAQATRCALTVTGLDDTGCGTGDHDGTTLHVPDLLPGERAEVTIDHLSPHRPEAWAHVTKRLGAPSADRVAPVCPGFGPCGGCVWQHLAYPAQLEAKHRRVVDALAGVATITIAPVRPSPVVVGYRNKGKYVAGRDGEHVVLGAYRQRSHEVVDTLGCRVVAPVIDEVATWLRGAAEGAGLVPYDERTRTGELRYLVIRESAGDVLVALIVAGKTPRAKLEQVAAALGKHPAVRGLVAIENDRRDGAIIPSGSTAHVLHGHGTLVEELAGARIELGAGEFFQVNRAQAIAMYERIVELAEVQPGVAVVDLFAGVGGIGLHLARAGAAVVAVEIDRDAVGALRRAARDANLPLTAIAGDAADVRGQLTTHPELVVVNPPRKGLSDQARALVAEWAPPTILYVSCGPESLARDLGALAKRGYAADTIEPFDLMPGTPQVETIVRLRRGRR
jgi:23S rRNA (uracil1939-C5)-methyltransferase